MPHFAASREQEANMPSIKEIATTAAIALAAIAVYNRFIAAKGKSVATLGADS